MRNLLLVCNLLVMTLCTIEKNTFLEFFHSVYDHDRDEKFDFGDWLAYYHSLDPTTDLADPIFYQTFDHYDKDKDGIVTLQEMIGYSPTITLNAGAKQIHLGLTNNDGQMQVMWITSPDRYARPCVKYGESVHNLTMSVNATYTTYHAGRLGFHGRIYRAVMTGLKPLQKYHYRVGDSVILTYSEPRSFVSPPNKGTHLPRIHFAAFGDMGTYVPMGHKVSDALFDYHQKDPFDFVFMNGDIAYAGISSDKVGEVEPIWDLYGQMTEKWTSTVAFMPGVGNHEHFYNFSAYTNRYHLPKSEGSNGNFWFSFDYGQLHLVHLSSEHDNTKGSPQYLFLQNDLRNARANGYTEWIMVAAHKPFYSSDKQSYSPNRTLTAHFQDLLNQYKVDLVQCGHQHSYERTWPVYHAQPLFEGANRTHYIKPLAPIYVVQGTGGAMIRYRFLSPTPSWSCRRQNQFGLGRIEIKGNMLKYQFLSVEGEVIDEWRIVK